MNLINRIVDLFRKRRILKAAKECGCDTDGDLLVYKGTYYIVFILARVIFRARIPEGENYGK